MNALNVAVAGLGNVGRETVRLLRERRAEFKERLGAELRLTAVADNDAAKEARALGLPASVARYKDPVEMARRAEADLFVELLGGLDAPKRFALTALGRGKALVTANKRLLAHAWPQITGAARANGARLAFEGSVAGGVPVLRALELSFSGDRVLGVDGILNGTTNYILSRGEEGLSPKMRSSRRRSSASPRRTRTWTSPARTPRRNFPCSPAWSRGLAQARLVSGRRHRVDLRARHRLRARAPGHDRAPDRLPALFRQARRPFGRRVGLADDGQARPSAGRRAAPVQRPDGPHRVGRRPDVLRPRRGRGPDGLRRARRRARALARHPGRTAAGRARRAQARAGLPDEAVSGWYLRLDVLDKPGALARIADALGREKVSIAAIHQDKASGARAVPVMIATHAASRHAFNMARKAILRQPAVLSKHCAMRMMA
ncbi:MAG: ACT domain-containing protein [Elusimicrobiota bacterium]|nr:MAG: ACT domain-containing protein [Elusimicrobiota bacterium]